MDGMRRPTFQERVLAATRRFHQGLIPKWWGQGNAGRRRELQWNLFVQGKAITDKMGRVTYFKNKKVNYGS
jgi:hypothetical protein